jgi:molybdenum cofactor cytidylyltransferase
MVHAIILAAGSSRRMGQPKALLTINGKSFVRHIVDVLAEAGVTSVVIVLGAEAAAIAATLSWFAGKIGVHEHWNDGQLSSLLAGLDLIDTERADGFLVCPVDRPLITPTLVRSLVDAFRTSGKRIVVPTFEGRRGHPTLFSVSLIEHLRAASSEVGARAVVHQFPGDVLEVPTIEEGTVINIDTPDEYEARIRR